MSEVLKLVHIAAIAVWCAGLISLPSLYIQRKSLSGPALHRLQRIVRAAYIVLVSPCAFVAVASGTALIFTEGVYQAWFAAKLAFVGVLAFVHVMTGLVIIRLFNEGESYHPARFVTVTCLTSVLVVAILWLVLAKPAVPDLHDDWFRPGGLRDIVAPFNPWARS